MSEIGQGSIIKKHSVTVFFVLTFLISLGVMLLLMLTGIGWLGLLAASGSCIAALITAAWAGGKEGLKQLLSGFKRWRCNPLWYVLAIFIPGVTTLIAIGLSGVFGIQFQVQ